MGPASRYDPAVPGHQVGRLSIGPVRRCWCSCGWRWDQPDDTMELGTARRLERDHLRAHLALAAGPADNGDWCREKPG